MPLKKPRVFYGYWIVVAAFLGIFIQSGCGLYAFSLFVRPLQAELGWSRGGIMAAFTIYIVVSGAASPFIGRMVDRYGVKKVIPTGALIAGVGFVFLSQMNDLWYFYVGYTILGVGMAAIGTVPASAVVSNWFKKQRGLAIGIMGTGSGGGGFVLAPLVGSYLIPNFGWRASYLALAILVWAFIIPVSLLVMKTKPADMGLYPDNIEAPEAVAMTKASLSASEGLTFKMALSTSTLWLIAITYLLVQFCTVGTIQNQVPHLGDIGFPVAAAAAALGGVGLASAIAKFGFGWICDRMPAKYVCSIGLVLQLISIIIIMRVGPASPLAIVWLYAVIMGVGMGSWLPTQSMLISTNFGLASYGAIFGLVTFIQNIGCAAGPLMAGYIYDTMNTYHLAFIIFCSLYAISIPAILMVRRPKAPRNFKAGF